MPWKRTGTILFDRAGRGEQVFQSFNWNWHWCNHYLREGRGPQLAIVTGRRAGRLVMLWPLVKERVAGLASSPGWASRQPIRRRADGDQHRALASCAPLGPIIASIKPDLVRLPRFATTLSSSRFSPSSAPSARNALRRCSPAARSQPTSDPVAQPPPLDRQASPSSVGHPREQAGNAAASALARRPSP